MERKILNYFETGYKWLQKIFSESILEVRKDFNKIDNSLKDVEGKVMLVEKAIKTKKDITDIKINNPQDINSDIVDSVKSLEDTIKKELPKINREINIKNDLTSLLGLFKTNSDKKDLIQAVKKVEESIRSIEFPKPEKVVLPDPINYEAVLEEISELLNDIKEKDNNSGEVISRLDSLIMALQMKQSIPDELIEKNRVKVVLRDDQVSKLGGVVTGGVNSSGIIDAINGLNDFSIPKYDTQVIDEADPDNVTITYKKNGSDVAVKTISVVGTTTTISVTLS